jgi:GTP-binding protein
LGTSVYEASTGTLIADILESGQTFTICEGGKGGHGNAFFKSSFNRAPTLHENGDFGEEKQVTLKIKYIADIGLVGLPNAGKSTFVGQVSSAKPKTANYQFTTLVPVLGIVNLHDEKVVFADLPGLIEGAAEGKGLGHEFLKHIERCSILLHLVSLNPADNENVVTAYKTITNELKEYSRALLDKPIIIVANKIDVDGTKANVKKLEKAIKGKLYVISALTKEGVTELLEVIYKDFQKIQAKNKQKLLAQTQKVKVIELKQQKDFTKDLKVIDLEDGR